jgi:CheY-like chemotaxis protein
MTNEQVSKLGTEYSRFNLEANRETEGIGLGMNITWNLIKLMNGSMSIDSTPGFGSTFTVSLPQKRIGHSVIGKDLAENLKSLNLGNSSKIKAMQMKRDYMSYGSVLIVDDVETNLYVAKGLMIPYGLSVETASSGFEAVNKIKTGNVYDIIFMDHMMPKMDGIEAAKIIRDMGYNKPIVALTANAVSGQAEMFLEHGFDDFISKPVDIRKLDIVLNKLIRDRYPAEVVEEARRQKAGLDKNIDKNSKPLIDSQLMEIFTKDAEKAVAVIEDIFKTVVLENNRFKDDDLNMFTITVHSMKSALANIGESELAQFAKKLEQAAREGNFAVISGETPAFLENLRQIIQRNKPIDNNEEIESSQDDTDFLHEKLCVIKTACAQFNRKTAKEALNCLKEKRWPPEIKEKLGVISELLLHSDFEGIERIIDEYIPN